MLFLTIFAYGVVTVQNEKNNSEHYNLTDLFRDSEKKKSQNKKFDNEKVTNASNKKQCKYLTIAFN